MVIPNWKNYEEGDMILTPNGDKAKILAKSKFAFLRSHWFRYDCASTWMTPKEAQAAGYKLMPRTGEIPYTKDELERMLGHKIKIINKK